MIKYVIYPSEYFNPNVADEEYEIERKAAEANGFDTIIYDYEKWHDDNKLLLNKRIELKEVALYRGWMMKPEVYEVFYNQLLEKNIELFIKPKEYELMHLFPNVYEYLKEDTAKIKIYTLGNKIEITDIKKYFDKFMIKDYVKSVKGTMFPKYFDSDMSQVEFDNWLEKFIGYRGDLLTGGICIKEVLPLKKYDGSTNEVRVFYFNNRIIECYESSIKDKNPSSIPVDLINKYKKLDSKFYTIDYAELEDGTWKILEAGDGGVSGINHLEIIETFYKFIRKNLE